MLKNMYWKGRRLDVLTRDELLEMIEWAFVQIERQRDELLAMRPHVDWVGYLEAKAMDRGPDQGATDDV